MQNIFGSQDAGAVATIRQTMSVSLDSDGTPFISFAMNRGKGTGAQSMPISEFEDYILALEEVVANGIPEKASAETAADVVRASIQAKDGIVSFRVRNGKGSKPARVPTEDFAEVVDLLRGTLDAVEGAGAKLTEE
jgi:hypothetical protein